MFTDVVGYTALGQRNEALSLALVEAQRKLIRPILNKHNGREVKTVGDSFLVEFPNALDAVRCAYDIQRTARELNLALPDDQRLHLRIGIHLGDVTKSRGDIQGDAVNVASRIESLAEDGGVCITRQVFDHITNKFDVPLKSLGSKSLKNVSAPLEIYKMVLPWEERNLATQLDLNRIAVLPFANMSPDPNDSYFADGITEEIISTLSGVSGLSVIARTSVMGYKGTTKKVKDIANELEAGSILEGSFRKAANKIRVTTQLIDVNRDKHVWAQSYDRTFDDVFSVQTDIAKQVAEALRVRISAPESDRIERKPTENTEAYSLYLRGRYHLDKRGFRDIEKAAECFARAVQEDTMYAPGYVGLADCHELLTWNFGIDVGTNHQKAATEVAKALELDGGLAEAHATRGLVLLHDFNFEKAEEEFRKAIELKPSYGPAHLWYFQLLRAELRWDEAIKHIRKAVEFDPFSQIINLNHGLFYASTGDYRKALEIDQEAAELDPNYPFAHIHLFNIYGRMKRFEDAKHEAGIVAGLLRESFPTDIKVLEAETAYFEGDTAAVRRLLPELEAHIGESPNCEAWRIAGLHFYLGQKDKGFEWLERSYSRKEPRLMWIKSSDFFDQIHSDPRYQNLLKRIGLGQDGLAQHNSFSE